MTNAAKTLLKDRDDLIASHDAITGDDQRSAGLRAAKVRKINLVQLFLQSDHGLVRDKDFTMWTSPVKTSGGSSGPATADLVSAIEKFSAIAEDESYDAVSRETATQVVNARTRTLKGRGLGPDGSALPEDESGEDESGSDE